MSITGKKPLKFFEFCKVTYVSAWSYIKKPDDWYIVKNAFRCIIRDCKEILIFILSYLFSLIYLIFFPFTSSVIFLIYVIRKKQLYKRN